LERRIKKFKNAEMLAGGLALKLKEEIEVISRNRDKFFISLSGGSTPKLLFTILAEPRFAENIKWHNLHLFWGDERCVPPEDSESNYGMTKKLLLDKIKMPDENIHRIKGEAVPEEEAERYADEIRNTVTIKNNLPIFNCILLGLGEDGHTASLFPEKELQSVEQNICGVAEKIITMNSDINVQKRISLTKDTICNAQQVIFLVTGNKKSKVLSDIINEKPAGENYPASGIKNIHGYSEWWIDEDAASIL
jgi:6-phosphogluconolactonase